MNNLSNLNHYAWANLLNDLSLTFNHITHPTTTSPLIQPIIEAFNLNPDNKPIGELLESREYITNTLLPVYGNLKENLLPHLTTYNGKVTPKILYTLTTDTYEYLRNSYVYKCNNCGAIQRHDEDLCYECDATTIDSDNTATSFEELPASETDYEFTSDDHCIEWEFLWSEWNDTLNHVFETHPAFKGMTRLEVHGYNLNWRGNDGFKFIELDPKELHSLLSIDQEPVTLTVNYDGTMEASCHHHDASSSFRIFPTVSCCISGEGIPYDEIEDAKKRAELVNALSQSDYYEYLLFDYYVDEVTNIAHSLNSESLTYLLMEDMHDLTLTKIEYYLELNNELS